MTGGSPGHLLTIEYSLKPLLATLKGESLQGIYIVDKCIDKQQPLEPIADHDTKIRLEAQLTQLLDVLNSEKTAIYA